MAFFPADRDITLPLACNSWQQESGSALVQPSEACALSMGHIRTGGFNEEYIPVHYLGMTSKVPRKFLS